MCIPQCRDFLAHLTITVDDDAPAGWGVSYDTIVTSRTDFNVLRRVPYLVDGPYVYEQVHPTQLRGSGADFTASGMIAWHLAGLRFRIDHGPAPLPQLPVVEAAGASRPRE